MVRIGRRYVGTASSSGSSRHAIKLGFDKDNSKGVPRNENKYAPINHPMMQKGIRRLGNQQFMNKDWYLGEPRKKNHEGKWLKNIQPGRKESAHLGKMTKGKAAKS